VVSSAWTDKGQVEVTVTNHDEEGVLLAIRPAMTIAGIVTMEDGTKLTARPRVVLVAHDVPFNGSEPWARVREDGSFEIGKPGSCALRCSASRLASRRSREVDSIRWARCDTYTHRSDRRFRGPA
jgi:hypothetical protein